MFRRWRHLGSILFLLVILLPTASIRTHTVAARPASAAPGGTVAIGYDAFPSGVNTFSIEYNLTEIALDFLWYASLVTVDPSTGLPAPDLAKSWNISPDGKVYTFQLRPGLRFSDGTSLTADDIAFSLGMAKRLAGQGNIDIFADPKETITIIDPMTVRVTFAKPYPNFLVNLAFPLAPIYEKRQMEKIPLADWSKQNWGTDFKIFPAVAGAYQVTGVVKGDHYTLTANPYYWRGMPKIHTVFFKAVPSDAALFSQVQAGDIQAIRLQPTFLDAVDRSRLAIYSSPGTVNNFLVINFKRPYFTDLRVRQALMYAINRTGIVKAVYKGYAGVLNSYIPTGFKGYYDTNLPNLYPYNPAQAKALLAAAGWKPGSDGILVKNGRRFAITMLYANNDAAQQTTVTIIQQNLAEVGISMRLRPVDLSNSYPEASKGHFDLFFEFSGPSYYPDQSNLYECNQTPPTGGNDGSYCAPAQTQLWEATRAGALSQQDLIRTVDQLQVDLNQDLPSIFLNTPDSLWVVDKRIKGFFVGQYGLYLNSVWQWSM